MNPVLRLDDAWVWDSWIADDGERYHLFYLKAPRALGDQTLRHLNAVIGHAVSADLVTWQQLPDALTPEPGSWDDVALWTGSVVRGDDGVWRMFYTAIGSRGHGGRDQRIGVALSDDLVTWRRGGDGPIVSPDARYRRLDEDPESSETWRDPFVLRDASAGVWRMLITARIAGGERNADGVLACASSPDLERWTLEGPRGGPGGFGQIEVPQVRRIDGRWLLVFTCHPDEQTAEQVARFGPHSTWSLVAPSPTGPFDLDAARPFVAEPDLFAAPLVALRDGGWALIGFRNRESQGLEQLWITDPIRVRLDGDRLRSF